VGLTEDLWVTLPRGRYDHMEATLELQSPLVAPLASDEVVGRLRVQLEDRTLAERNLYPLAATPEGGVLRRTLDSVLLWLE
jgi:D-alanyl-D-alanine carboxypeptidase (penicillin-binding protein 5/6)